MLIFPRPHEPNPIVGAGGCPHPPYAIADGGYCIDCGADLDQREDDDR